MKTNVKNLTKVHQVASIGSGHSVWWDPGQEKKLTSEELEAPRVKSLIRRGLVVVLKSDAPEKQRELFGGSKTKKSKGGDT